jgi:hypothetical protein
MKKVLIYSPYNGNLTIPNQQSTINNHQSTIPNHHLPPIFRRIFLGKRLELPPLVDNSPLRLVGALALSYAGQPDLRLQEVIVALPQTKTKRSISKTSFFILKVFLYCNTFIRVNDAKIGKKLRKRP